MAEPDQKIQSWLRDNLPSLIYIILLLRALAQLSGLLRPLKDRPCVKNKQRPHLINFFNASYSIAR